jgi:hypothetical protein
MILKSELALTARDAAARTDIDGAGDRASAARRRPRLGAVGARSEDAFGRGTGAAWAIILAFLLIRLSLMFGLGLGVDEAYTLANSQSLALSYFDHPPLHQWIAQASLTLFGHTPWVRLPFVLMFAGTSWFLFVLTRHLYGGRAARWALVALNLSAFFTVSAGGWVVPDGPLLFCLAAAACEMARLFFPGEEAQRPWKSWLVIGVWVGLAGLSKYSAVLTMVGLFGFLTTSRTHRRWLAHPAPYVAGAIALAILTPVFVWNARNGWLSFAFQSGRGLPEHQVNPSHLLGMIAGQIALLLPWVFIPLVMALAAALRSARHDGRAAFLVSLSLPAILVFTIVPLWGARGFPHWPMPGWFFVFPLLGAWLAQGGVPWLRPRVWSLVSGIAFALLIGGVVSHASSGWGRRVWPSVFAAGDPTLESFSWGELRATPPFAGHQPDFIVAPRWMDGAKLAAAFEGSIPVLVFSNDPRQFAFSHDVGDYLHKDAMIVLGAAGADRELLGLAPYFASLDVPETVWLGRAGMKEVPLVVVRATGLVRPYPMPYPARTSAPELPGQPQ